MFRLIAAIAIIMMPIVSVVSTGSDQNPIQSRDIFDDEGCTEVGDKCGTGGGGGGSDPFANGGSWKRDRN
jgi:hypothetical protein